MPCPICKTNVQATSFGALAQQKQIDCPRCGRFRFTDVFENTRPNLAALQVATISGWTREHQGVEFRGNDWEGLVVLRPPSVGEKADKLLLLLTRQFPTAGQAITFQPTPEILSACWAVDEAEANYLFNSYLTGHKRFLASPDHGGMPWKIAPAGWDYIHSLGRTNVDSGIGFCAMWFDDRLEAVWANGLEPAIEAAGYEPKRIDKHPHNNRIDDEIIAMIRRSKFVVSDLTGNRAGVYFESGFAFGLGLPVIWTCRMDRLHRVHFDNRQYNFVLWRPDQLPQFKAALQFRIEATVGRGPVT
jgi:hypothetical protein